METALYLPVKRFLEARGFTVKGEIGGCDLVALNGDNPPIVIVGELKLTFNLELVLQGVDRAGACDEVWLAARLSKLGKGRESDARYRNLCRRLGFGMLGVTSSGQVELLVSPPTVSPRRNPKRRSRLVSEHERRKGDPAMGGSTRAPIMTAYRQRALTCAAALTTGPRPPRELKSEIPDAAKILLRNVYGWFNRAGRGFYTLSDAGRAALQRWPQPVEQAVEMLPTESAPSMQAVPKPPTMDLKPARRTSRTTGSTAVKKPAGRRSAKKSPATRAASARMVGLSD